MKTLNTTSFAVLGLLSLRPWTTYELAKQMERSLHHFWPRAESNLFEEPKNLVEHGLAQVEHRFTGRRPRAVYTITDEGRRALADWVAQSGNVEPTLEFEALIRITFADNAPKENLIALLDAVQQASENWVKFDVDRAREYLDGGGPFPNRLHVIALVSRFIHSYRQMVSDWAAWAQEEVRTWPNTSTVNSTSLVEHVYRPILGEVNGKVEQPTVANAEDAAREP